MRRMTAHEKHDLLVAVISLFIIIPLLAGIPLGCAYWTSAKSVHIPDDVRKAGLGLAGLSAVGGGVVGAGFTDLVSSSVQKNFADAMKCPQRW